MQTMLIRTVFHHYSQPENRLTHGLIQVLARDQRLTRHFIRAFAGVDAPTRSHLSFACQVAPGESSRLTGEVVTAKSSVPDAWIFQEGGPWALIIESKVVGAQLEEDQLRRHIETAGRKGFQSLHLLAVTAEDAAPAWLTGLSTKADVRWTAWARVYEFLSRRESYSNPIAKFLGQQFLDYLRVAEARQMAGERVLTSFTGIPFGPDHPYNEPEARVVLRALMQKLHPRLASSNVLHVSSSVERKPLTGAWDVISFEFAHGEPFTKHPHLTVWLGDGAAIQLTIPNRAKVEYWKRLRGADSEALDGVFSKVVERIRPLRRTLGRGLTEPRVILEITQQHFHAQTQEITDGRLNFDLDTIYAGEGSVKPLPAWLEATRVILADCGRANVQVSLEAHYPYVEGSASRTPEFIDNLVTAAEALHPFLAFLQGADWSHSSPPRSE